MIREILSSFFTGRVFYIMFSILVAIALWMYVEISVNQEVETAINATIEFRNEDILRDRNLFRADVRPDNVRLTFFSTRNIAQTLIREGVSVVVDLAAIETTGTVALNYTIVFPVGINQNALTLRGTSTDTITLFIDRLSSIIIPVRGVYEGGTASEEFIADPPQFSPDTIEVSGPATVLSEIYSAWVPIVRENLSTTLIDEMPFVLLNAGGYEVELYQYGDSVSFSHETIRVTIPVRMQKEVVLLVNLVEGAGATEANTSVRIVPETITVAGDPEALQYFNTITLRTIDLTSFSQFYSFTVPIPIDNELINITGETEASVTVEILGLELHHFSVTSLHVTNVPPGYVAEIRTHSIDIGIRGRAGDLARIEAINIRVVADLSGLTAGTTRVPTRIYIDGGIENIGAIGSYLMTVNISLEPEPEDYEYDTDEE